MVVKDLKSKAGQRKPKEDNSDDEGEEDLYNLVRGGKKSSLVIQRLQDEEEFVPTRNLRERVIMMISSDESDSSNYIPKKRKIEKEEEIKEIKNDEKSGSASPKGVSPTPKIFTMAFQKESQPTLKPRAQWTAKEDARSDTEADAE